MYSLTILKKIKVSTAIHGWLSSGHRKFNQRKRTSFPRLLTMLSYKGVFKSAHFEPVAYNPISYKD